MPRVSATDGRIRAERHAETLGMVRSRIPGWRKTFVHHDATRQAEGLLTSRDHESAAAALRVYVAGRYCASYLWCLAWRNISRVFDVFGG
ncbi:MAG TPA: hypothetical protein VKT77_19515 [Chthonomonadaceae bacterium]|nr:hypothetical protein [Chthonomonadaceae bacterium]